MTDEQSIELFIQNADKLTFGPAKMMASEILRLRAEVDKLRSENQDLTFAVSSMRAALNMQSQAQA